MPCVRVPGAVNAPDSDSSGGNSSYTQGFWTCQVPDAIEESAKETSGEEFSVSQGSFSRLDSSRAFRMGSFTSGPFSGDEFSSSVKSKH